MTITASDLLEITEGMFQLIQTKCEIVKLEVKNQNAPGYLHRQAEAIQEAILFKLRLEVEEEEKE